MIQVFGIGNPLLEDDGIGIVVAKALENTKELRIHLAEIFVDDALELVDETAYIILLDAVRLGKKPGEVCCIPFETCRNMVCQQEFCHTMGLLHHLLFLYPKIRGELIGIEIRKIAYYEGLSVELEERLPEIIQTVRTRIDELRRREEFDA